MSPQQKAAELGLTFPPQTPGYLNLCIRTGNLLMTSGHVSDTKGILGGGLSIEQGYAAARECAVKILRSVHQEHGTLDGLRVIKLLGCVYSTGNSRTSTWLLTATRTCCTRFLAKMATATTPAAHLALPPSPPVRRWRSRRFLRLRVLNAC